MSLDNSVKSIDGNSYGRCHRHFDIHDICMCVCMPRKWIAYCALFLWMELQTSCILNSCCVRKNVRKMVCFTICYLLLLYNCCHVLYTVATYCCHVLYTVATYCCHVLYTVAIFCCHVLYYVAIYCCHMLCTVVMHYILLLYTVVMHYILLSCAIYCCHKLYVAFNLPVRL